MFIFAVFIVISVVMYIYYKVAILKTKETLIQKYNNAMARIFLGTFLIFFAINQYLAVQIKVVLLISIVFLILGIMQFVDGFKQARHYRSEWRRLNPEQ